MENAQSGGDLPPKTTRALGFFTHEEALAVEAAMGRIFPDDELGPGAIEAGALYYLDRALAGAEAHLQGFYRSGLRQLDAAARARFGRSFAECAPVQQDDLIEAMARDALPAFGKTPPAAAFFEALRSHTIEGVFSDPVHGGNRDFAGWKLLGYPGPQPSYSHEEQQLDAVIVRDRIFTAADYPLPSSEEGDQ
jgi:gluconate 2-dehydrogenase gamma chain